MPVPKPAHTAEFRQQMVELAPAGRKPGELAAEFDLSAQGISTWVARAAADGDRPARSKDVLTSAGRNELARLRREGRQLEQERDALAKATAARAEFRQTGAR